MLETILEDKYYNIEETSDYLCLLRREIRILASSNAIESKKVRCKWYMLGSSILNYKKESGDHLISQKYKEKLLSD